MQFSTTVPLSCFGRNTSLLNRVTPSPQLPDKASWCEHRTTGSTKVSNHICMHVCKQAFTKKQILIYKTSNRDTIVVLHNIMYKGPANSDCKWGSEKSWKFYLLFIFRAWSTQILHMGLESWRVEWGKECYRLPSYLLRFLYPVNHCFYSTSINHSN